MNSSGASATCRLEWRRSRWLPAALCALVAAAIAALWLSGLPLIACAVGAALVVVYGGWMLRREMHRPECTLTWQGGEREWQIETNGITESLRHIGASFRGGLVVLTLADMDNAQRRYVWWPDTLDARGRRSLRLALLVKETSTPTQAPLPQ
jgi:toxin CptA